jgi:hypothetical protein
MSIDFTDYDTVINLLPQVQEADRDNRERSRDSIRFLNKKDGQWDEGISQRMGSDRVRMTFDKVNPIIDDKAGDIKNKSFGIVVKPTGGEATKELAKQLNGVIRSIQNVSDAESIYNSAARKLVGSGLAGWEVVHDYIDGDSFDQDLIIRPIQDFVNRVWFVGGGTKPTQEDAPGVFIIDHITKSEYESKFPDGSGQGIGSDKCSETYYDKDDLIGVGRIIYKEFSAQTIVLMSDGSTRKKDDDFDKIKDELAGQNITIAVDDDGNPRERKRQQVKVFSRMFDGKEWLGPAEETAFKHLPVIPMMSNFDIDDEGKITYWSITEKLMDAQRSYNMLRSREMEDVANSPVPKYWATRKQFEQEADRASVRTLNTNRDPLQLYTFDPENPTPPAFLGGAIVNPGLQAASQGALNDIQTSSNSFNPEAMQSSGPLSQIAIKALEDKGSEGSQPYIESMKMAICQTGNVLVGAMGVYDTQRLVTILDEDGSQQDVMINEKTFDHQTESFVVSNDLRKGKYAVTCDVGPLYKNKQDKTVSGLQELSAIMPELGPVVGDIILSNMVGPGMDLASERIRQQLLQAGVIPPSQYTEEEQQAIQAAQQAAAQQPPEQTPEDKFANAELGRVKAETADVEARAVLKQEELRIKEQQILLDAQDKAEKRDLEEMKLMMQQQAQQIKVQQDQIAALAQGRQAEIDNLNTQADTAKKLREAMGVDAIVGPGAANAVVEQYEQISDAQESVEADLDLTQ